jgi:LacI family transcriptional regulator, gluconate utilization system Gnt-I transcriptional repressor
VNTRTPARTGRTSIASVKITDVAARAGVAPMTVSRVLNTPDRVSPPTAARVRAAIEELGYMPNLIAGGLSSRKSRMIAAIVPTIASPMFSAPIQTFTDAMAAAGYHVMLALSGYDQDSEDAQIRAVLARRPDGLLLTGAHRSPAIRDLLRDSNLPVVEIWDTSDDPTDVLVGFDHAEMGAAVADFFVRQGHARFAVLAARDPRAKLRRQGFVDRIAHHGLTMVAERVLEAPSSIEDGRSGLRQIVGQLNQRTALFCSSDLVAFGALTEARLHGIAVPDTLAICGFGDFEISRSCHPPISTVHVDGAEIGEMAARELLARIQGASVPARISVPFQILPRATT